MITWLLHATKKNTCGSHKHNEYDKEQFISPLDKDCESKLRYNAFSGEIKVTDENEYTVDLLNLNEYRLIQIRRAIEEMSLISTFYPWTPMF